LTFVKTYSRLFFALLVTAGSLASAQSAKIPSQTILFGAAYYEEYAPTASTRTSA
jgi:hypothetical protein